MCQSSKNHTIKDQLIKNKMPDTRYLNDMREVIYDKEWSKNAPDLELYYMYRNVKKENGLRYDITIIPFQMLGKEFVKTKGHEHPGNFTELYEVLEGKAIFLMQKHKNDGIENVYIVKAKKGDKIFIPAHYAHVTINPGQRDLKLSNWVADNFKSNYGLMSKKKGAGYFAIKEKGELKWVKNENYKNIPKLRSEEPNKNIPENLQNALKGL